MKTSENKEILKYLSTKTKPEYEGVIEDYIRMNFNYKASNVARVCRKLREKGYILKIPQKHPENNSEVNSYIITEKGREKLLEGLSEEAKSFMREWGPKPKLETTVSNTLF